MGICCGEDKQCYHDWQLIESCDNDTEYGFESGNQYVISEGQHYQIYQCNKCGEKDKREKY